MRKRRLDIILINNNMEQRELTYKEAVAEIEEILHKLEEDEPDVDILSEKVKRVSFLIRYCKEKLQKTETEVSTILKEMEEG